MARMASILIVEDEPAVLKLLSRASEEAGHEVVTATNGKDGITKFTIGKFDVIVTDIIMSGGDGIKFIEEMLELSPDTKILAISGGGSAVEFDYLGAAAKYGAITTLSKPFELDAFYSALARCLGE